MIQIYKSGNTNYSHNGDVAIQPTQCDLDITLNGEWELELEAPIDDLGKYRFVFTGNVVSAPTPRGVQLFRIYDHAITETGAVGLARPIFLDAKDEVMIVDKRPSNSGGQNTLDMLMAGTRYKGKSDITDPATAYYIRKNLIEALASNDENSFINRWGGEILYNNYTVEINKRIGIDRSLRVEFGRNIKSIKDHGNSEDLATRLYPVAFNGRMMTGNYVDSDNIDAYPIIYAKILKCEDIKLREDINGDPEDGDIVCEDQKALDKALRKRCMEQYEQGIDKLVLDYEVDMDDLSTKEEYRDYKNLEKVDLGDTIHVRHKKLNITVAARILRLVYDCIRKKNKKLYIGNCKKDYFSKLNSTLAEQQKAIEQAPTRTAMQQAIDHQTQLITGNLGGYKIERDSDGDGYYDETLYMDAPTVEESVDVLRINKSGIGFSHSGYNGPYLTAWTLDGRFNANFITAGTLDASKVNVTNLNAFNITSGTLSADRIAAGSIKADKLNITDLSALKATIGSFTIGQSAMYNGLSGLDGKTDGVYVGTDGIALGAGKFKVTKDGTLRAESAYISGEIHTGSGVIGGFTIGQSAIYSTLSSFGGTANGVYIGTDGISLGGGKFKVDSQGNLTAVSGTFLGTVRASQILTGGDNGFITGGQIDKATIGGGNIAANTIGNGNMGQDSISNWNLQSQSVKNSTIMNGAGITSGKFSQDVQNILADAITAGKVIAGTTSVDTLKADNFQLAGHRINRGTISYKNSSNTNATLNVLTWAS